MPHNAIPRHREVEQRLLDLAEFAETTELNRVEMGDTRVGIVASGAAYGYAREAVPGASFLKIGLSWPLPKQLIADFRAKVDKLYVVEELDPFLEENIRLQGVHVDGGKDILPLCGEFNPGLVAKVLHAAGVPGVDESLMLEIADPDADLPDRPPTLCPGCSHRGVFVALRKLRAYVSGDIGCYSLGALPPFDSMHCSTCMGAGISMAHGMAKVMGNEADSKNRPVADDRRQHLLPLRHHVAARRRLQPEQRRHGDRRQPHHRHDRRAGVPERRQDPAGQGRADRRHPGARTRPRHQARPRSGPVQRRRGAGRAQGGDRGRRAVRGHRHCALRARVPHQGPGLLRGRR